MTRSIPLAPLREWTSLPIGAAPGARQVTRTEADALLAAAAAHPLARDGGANLLAEHRGQLRAQQHVGVIAAGGCVLEILPKIDPELPDASPGESAADLRGQLAAMLDVAWELEIGAGAVTAMAREATSLLDVLIRMFADRLLVETRRGLPRQYLAMAEDLPRLRGRLDVVRQYTHHALRRDRLACRFDELSYDSVLLQIMKAAVVLCDRHARGIETRRRLAELRFVLAEVRDVAPAALLQQAVRIDRTNGRWRGLLALARMLLGRRYQDTRIAPGAPEGMALLFPMNDLFEVWVAVLLRRAVAHSPDLKGITVTTQGGKRYCLGAWEDAADCHGTAFQTIPDIILERQGRRAIIDTKWKRLADPPIGARKGVQQSDIYQLMAYARIYRCDRLMLLYPAAQDEDTAPIEPFGIDGGREMLALRRIAPTSDSGAAMAALTSITRYLLDCANARSREHIPFAKVF